MRDADIIFDQSFPGLTQLYDPTADPTEITADIVAITGLDGHAYGVLERRQSETDVASRFPKRGFTQVPSDLRI